MDFSNMKLFTALKAKMSYLSERQTVIASNIANANTPRYKAKDLAPLNFDKMVDSEMRRLPMATTRSGHIAGNGVPMGNFKIMTLKETGETTPDGNNVVLEDETMKMAQAAHDHQLATRIYKKVSGMIRAAAGGQG